MSFKDFIVENYAFKTAQDYTGLMPQRLRGSRSCQIARAVGLNTAGFLATLPLISMVFGIASIVTVKSQRIGSNDPHRTYKLILASLLVLSLGLLLLPLMIYGYAVRKQQQSGMLEGRAKEIPPDYLL